MTSDETFRAEIFADPWSTFEKINTYGVSEVPESGALRGVLEVLALPPVADEVPPSRRRYDE